MIRLACDVTDAPAAASTSSRLADFACHTRASPLFVTCAVYGAVEFKCDQEYEKSRREARGSAAERIARETAHFGWHAARSLTSEAQHLIHVAAKAVERAACAALKAEQTTSELLDSVSVVVLLTHEDEANSKGMAVDIVADAQRRVRLATDEHEEVTSNLMQARRRESDLQAILVKLRNTH